MHFTIYLYGTSEHRNKYLGTIFLSQKEEENNNAAADRIKKREGL